MRRATLAGLGAIVVWSAMVALLRLVSDDFGATLGMALVYSYPSYIEKVGLTPADALFLEETVDQRFSISLVAREDNQDSEKIQVLRRAMTSDAIRSFLEEEHSDTLLPSF